MLLKDLFFLIFGMVFLIPLTSAVFIDTDVLLNTSVSNSSITFSVPVTADRIEISSTYIYLMNVTTPDGFCDLINHSEENSNLDSADFQCTGEINNNDYEINNDEDNDPKGNNNDYKTGSSSGSSPSSWVTTSMTNEEVITNTIELGQGEGKIVKLKEDNKKNNASWLGIFVIMIFISLILIISILIIKQILVSEGRTD